jgi:hypothetical protein
MYRKEFSGSPSSYPGRLKPRWKDLDTSRASVPPLMAPAAPPADFTHGPKRTGGLCLWSKTTVRFLSCWRPTRAKSTVSP